MSKAFSVRGKLVNIEEEKIYPVQIQILENKIIAIEKLETQDELPYLLPGFVDAHVHIESSMLTPAEFARMAVVHGTVATVSDPHEIANVMGVEGVEYMIENGQRVPFKFYFGAPSCVPATTFETAGAEVTAEQIDELLQKPEVKYLAEMMNWPGVLYNDEEVFKKIEIAKKHNKPIDGHAPGLKGEQAKQYIAAGISTDHECFTKEEALDKLREGMKVIIREGSAAKNFEALVDLIHNYCNKMMFCSDDKHPDSLVEGHINDLVKRAISRGIDLFKVLRVACVNPVEHYNLEVGQLKEGDAADFIVVKDLEDFKVLKTYVNGELVAEEGKSNIEHLQSEIINNFDTSIKTTEQFVVKAEEGQSTIAVIEVIDGELITKRLEVPANIEDGKVLTDTENDILKITVVNRYKDAEPAVAFIKNFGLTSGAIASSVGHDSHNIIAVGVDDESICEAVNMLIKSKGGLAAVRGVETAVLPLPIAGLMTGEDGYEVAQQYIKIDKMAKKMGSKLISPFMSLSFMALLVIPEIKLSDLGLFDGQRFEFIDLFVSEGASTEEEKEESAAVEAEQTEVVAETSDETETVDEEKQDS
ncbi:adenine deaminase [marine bacterium AO1-C]|nr:adenine deaminase [marine bacterium AO1-C]